MTKKIHFITQAKGGSGKSVLAFMLAEKYQQATILDLDDATTTSMKQLAYRDPIHVPFLDQNTKRIDRGAFNSLFESVVQEDSHLFIADLGASVAEQLPKYFVVSKVDVIADLLVRNEIQLELICVIGGGNIFKATIDYLHELVESIHGRLKLTVAHNGFYPLSVQQLADLNAYLDYHQLKCIEFDLVADKGEMAMRTVENVLKEGKGTAGLSPFTSIYCTNPL